MNTIQINFADFVQIQEAQPVTNSKFVAEAFGKRHDNVIAKIDELKAEIPASFHILNFKEMEIETEIGLGKTRKAKAYELTKDGFMLLVMGFTGKAAILPSESKQVTIPLPLQSAAQAWRPVSFYTA